MQTASDVGRRRFLAGGAAAAAAIGVANVARAEGALSGKVVLITGATQGLGREIARAFAAEGARISFCGLEQADGRALADEISGAGGVAVYLAGDVRRDEDVQSMVATVADREGRLDIAINNAAILGVLERTGSQTMDNWTNVMATNAYGVHRCMHHEARLMAQSGEGVIVNVGSTGAGDPVAGLAVYCASKAAIHTMTQAAANELGPRGIRVVALLPGKMQGGMTEVYLGQSGMSPAELPDLPAFEEVALDVLWLASEQAAEAHGELMTREKIAQRR